MDDNADPQAESADDIVAGMKATETHLRHELRQYAAALRALAYTVPGGVGEWALLELSARMISTADQAGNRHRSGDVNSVIASPKFRTEIAGARKDAGGQPF